MPIIKDRSPDECLKDDHWSPMAEGKNALPMPVLRPGR